jgi:predicted ATPase/DNA-binding CsgD family transcriptional regulator
MVSIDSRFPVTQTIMQPSFVNVQATLRHLPTSIPIMPTRFVGRQRELDEVSQLVKSTRLITLIGAAGCGKTRLAQRVADQIYPLYPEGVYWVELAPLDDPMLIPQALAAVLNLPEQTDAPVEAGLVKALEDRELLIILDNCEHLLNDTASLVSKLLSSTRVSVLATSREPLGIVGEQRYPVRPMALPDADLPLSELAKNEALRLFIERAQAVVPQFALTPQNGPVIAGICRRLDGIPLAIELAAARLNILTVEQIAARLHDRFHLFATAPHLTLTQHQTLYAAIAWSDRLLSPNEQAMLRRMAVFAAGCSLEIAVVVCGEDGSEQGQALTILSSLVDKSLVVADTTQGSEARYRLLEMIRQYAREKLIEAGEWETIHTRLLDYFVERSHALSLPSPFAQIAPTDLAWLEREYDNIRVALAWALEHHQIEAGLSIANAVYALWDVRNTVREGRLWYERFFVHLNDALPLALQVTALTNAAYLAMHFGDASAAFAWSRAAVTLCERSGEEGQAWIAYALTGVAGAARAAGDVDTLFQVNERIIPLAREAGDVLALGMSYYAHGVTTMVRGDYQAAHQLFHEALLAARRDDDFNRLALVLNAMGDLARCEGRFRQAATCYEESVAICRKFGALRELTTAEIGLVRAWVRLGECENACDLLRHNLSGHGARGDRYGILQALAAFSGWAAAVGLLTASVRLMAVVAHHEDSRQSLLDSAHEADQRDDAVYRETCLQQLGAATFEAEYNIGKILSLDQAVEFALSLAPPDIPAAAAQDIPGAALTRREREIVALIGRGFANGDIADRLVLSKRTVEKHIANILSKLGFDTRAQIIRWAVENDLLRQA